MTDQIPEEATKADQNDDWRHEPEGSTVSVNDPGYQVNARAFNAITKTAGEEGIFIPRDVRSKLAAAAVAEIAPFVILFDRERRPRCPTMCDADCEQVCHEVHQPAWKRDHNPEVCKGSIVAAAVEARTREHVQEQDAIRRDLGHLLEALGLGDHARPESPHEVMLQCITEAKRLRHGPVLAAIFACPEADCPRPFALHRKSDVTGVSGTGTVAHGVQFADGTVVIRWRGEHPSTVVWASLDDAMAVHGHDGRTRVVWVATDFSEMATAEQEAAAAERERIAELAERGNAKYLHFPRANMPGEYRPFADLIREIP